MEKNLYIIKSKGSNAKYLGLGVRRIKQMSAKNYLANDVLIFKDKEVADSYCEIAQKYLAKGDVKYAVKPYANKQPILNDDLVPIATLAGTAYVRATW